MTEKTTIACDAKPAISPGRSPEPKQAAQTPDALALKPPPRRRLSPRRRGRVLPHAWPA